MTFFDLTSLQLFGWIIIIRVDYEYTVYTVRNKYLKLICHSEVFVANLSSGTNPMIENKFDSVDDKTV